MSEAGLFLTLEIDRESGRLLRIFPSAQNEEEFEISEKLISRILPLNDGWVKRLIRVAGRR